MATFADLPSDIIIAIASFQRPAKEKVSGWRRTLWILSICRSWRAAMLHDIYGTVFIAIPEDHRYSHPSATWCLPPHHITPYTNAGLIYNNGYGYLVKRISIRTLSAEDMPFPWLYVAEELNINKNDFPDILAARKLMETSMSAEYQIASQNSAWIDAFSSVACVLPLRFPNVSSLKINTGKYCMIHAYVISKLVSAYAQQLVKVKLCNFDTESAFLEATNIRYFDSYISDDFQRAPYINPEMLVCLKLQNVLSSDIWTQFVCDNNTKSIVFTNLESLELRRKSSGANMSLDIESWHLKFPKLTHLKLDSGRLLTNKELKLMALNLKVLDYSGSAEDAIVLLENNTGGLEKLHLSFPMYMDNECDDEWFISDTNDIFSMVGPISEVSLMGVLIHSSCMPNFYWPNLTRLEIATSLEPYDFLFSIDCMPHLRHLYLIIKSLPDEDNYGSADEEDNHSNSSAELGSYPDEALSELKHLKRSEQSQSKLETLTIHWFTRYAYAWYAHNCVMSLDSDNDPRLEMISERQQENQTIKLYNSQHDNFDSHDKDDSDVSDFSTEYGWMHDINVLNRETRIENAEADTALWAYFPNLVATKYAKVTRDRY